MNHSFSFLLRALAPWRFLELSLVVCIAGCSAAPRTTTLQQQDMNDATQAMAASLIGSGFLRDRSAGSPPAVIVIEKVENRTSDIIPPAEQWMLMHRVAHAVPVLDLKRTRNVSFQLPPEKQALLREEGLIGDEPATVRATHVMSAAFLSSTRVGHDKDGLVNTRSDYYLMEYRITDLSGRRLVWDDRFELKRAARGRTND